MGRIKRFEDVQAWQKARELARILYQATNAGPFSRDIYLRNQIRSAASSIMANIAEGFGRKSKKEFANFLNIAHGSSAEVQSHLYVALDQGYLTPEDFEVLHANTEEVSRMLKGFMRYLNSATLNS